MLSMETASYSKKYKLRLLVVIGLLFLAAIYVKREIYEILRLSNLLADGASLTFPDYLMRTFNSTQFLMFFIFPLLFSVLVADLINFDYHNESIDFIFPRIKNRLSYLANKCIIVFLLAILFTCLISAITFLVAVIFNIPFINDKYHYIFEFMERRDGSNLMVYISMLSTFIFGLTFIGLLTLVMSVYTGSGGVAIGVIIILGFSTTPYI